MSSAATAFTGEREDARRDAAIECAFCGRPATAIHAIPSFTHPERVVLVCDHHEADGDRSALARPGSPPGPAAEAVAPVDPRRIERLAAALTLVGRALLALAVVLAVIYLIAQL